MEEILSSIKRIIAEDSEAPRRADSAPADDESEVLELTDAMDEAEAESASESAEEFVAFEPEPQIQPEPEPEPVVARAEPPRRASEREARALLSTATEDATRQALSALSRMIVKPEAPAADNTLEGLVRDMLRPMLKDWLDANLSGIVQATVDREVARISGRLG
jgi:uncharacterized protein